MFTVASQSFRRLSWLGSSMTDALGLRLLSRIDTSVTRETLLFDGDSEPEASPLLTFPSKLSGLGLPSVRLSASPIADEPSLTFQSQPIPTDIHVRRNGSRKLLSHVLRRLAHRKKPPPVKDMVWNGTHDTTVRGFGGTLKDFVKLMPDKRVGIQNDSDDEESRGFSTDETFDLMLQLKDVLTTSIAQGWKIFDDRFAAFFHLNRSFNVFQSSSPRRHGRCKFEILLNISSIAE